MRAIANLAGSINGLANLIDAAAGRLRQQLALDEALPTVLEYQPAGGDNTSLDGGSNGTAKRKAKAGTV
jgi:hypothetical protein